MWLNLLVDECQYDNVTKKIIKKEKPCGGRFQIVFLL